MSYQGTNILYLKGKKDTVSKRVLAIDELYDTLDSLHRLEGNHTGRTKLYKQVALKYHGVTEKICRLFVKTCQVCFLKKAKRSLKSVVVKPITATDFLSRAQIDLIDMNDQNLQVNLSADGVTPYKFLFVYLDHFTKKINLVPLKRMSTEEVCEKLLDIFCDSHHTHTSYTQIMVRNSQTIYFTTLATKWPKIKIVHGKPRHPESQGAVERANRDIKDGLFGKMHDNNDHCWVKYLRWVQWDHNTSYHAAIRMTPYEAVYNKKPPMGLMNIGIPYEFWPDINTEEDIEVFQVNIALPGLAEVQNEEFEVSESQSDDDYRSRTSIPSPPCSKFPTQIDEHQDQISTNESHPDTIPPLQLNPLLSENQISDEILGQNSYPPASPLFTSPKANGSVSTRDCVACGEETSGAHSCPRCIGFIHVICGRSEGEEGYGSSVVCPACDHSSRREACSKMRAGIKRNQEIQQDRMLNTASKRFKHAEVGDSVLIPISQPDKIQCLGPRNILGCISLRVEMIHHTLSAQFKEHWQLITVVTSSKYVQLNLCR